MRDFLVFHDVLIFEVFLNKRFRKFRSDFLLPRAQFESGPNKHGQTGPPFFQDSPSWARQNLNPDKNDIGQLPLCLRWLT